MIPALIVTLAVLAQAAAPGATRVADGPQSRTEAEAAILLEYQSRLKNTRRTAEAQLDLARWCKERGLVNESDVHASAAVAIDPKKEAAWLMLGYQKVGGRWVSPVQAREEAEQKVADREWGPKLTALHRTLHGPAKKGKAAAEQAAQIEAAREALGKIDQAPAVPSFYREFARGGPDDQAIAVQVLSQIGAARASQLLASLAIYGATPEVRRRATETLRQRKPADYVGTLLGLLREPMSYKFVPGSDSGVGEMGRLEIEDEHHILWRSYKGVLEGAPRDGPDLSVHQGDAITYDAGGAPVILRKGGGSVSYREVVERIAQEHRNLTMAAREQLTRDLAGIESENLARRTFNDIVLLVLKAATGQALGDQKQAWSDWLADSQGLPRRSPVREHKRTFFQNVRPYTVSLPWDTSLAFLSLPYEGIPFT